MNSYVIFILLLSNYYKFRIIDWFSLHLLLVSAAIQSQPIKEHQENEINESSETDHLQASE